MESPLFPLTPDLMVELLAGLLSLIAWGVLQFVVQPATGLIHIALVAGVILVIRGVVLRSEERAGPK